MRNNYQSDAMRALRDQQVRFAPRDRKLEQVTAAETLIAELDSSRKYSFEYLCFRITGFRPEAMPPATLFGEIARRDLLLLIEDLSDSAEHRPEEAGDRVYTIDQLASEYDVSTKTISRWRQQGLVSRKFLMDGRKRVGFLKRSVERFVAVNRERVERGERFRQLTDVERQEIIFRARRLAAAGGGPAEIYRRIAKHTNRSVETIRHTVKQFGQRYPGLAVFPGRNGKLDDEAKKKIFRLFRQGHGVEFLVKRFGRTRTTIYRVIQEVRSKRIMELPLDFMFNEDFTKPGAAKKILVETPPNVAAVRKSNTPVGLPQYLASLYDVALLTREQEIHIFRQFNYLKYRANKLREGLKSGRLRTSTMDRIEGFYEQAVRVKNRIVQANLRLVVSIAKRHVGTNEDFFGLVSDGNMSLIRAVEKFDYGRGFKFSTYSSWAIMKNFARSIPEEFKHRDRFRTSQDEMFLLQEDLREDEFAQENMNQVRKQQIRKMLAHLDDREKKIIIRRFGLNPGEEPLTLQEVGLELGVTKERIRQLEARALTKLRCVAKDERLELPD